MQVSVNWLNEFVDLSNVEDSQLAHELTMSGLEVEGMEEVTPKFTNIITVKIEKIENHPNSDHLHLVTVNTGSGLKTVVCGAQNIKEGQVVPYASVGSQVLNRKTGEMFTLTPAVIRGVESQGMLCSADELGVSERNYQEEDGILILNRFLPDVKIGQNLVDVLGFEKDTILDVAPTANRGDQMSVVGIARELSSLFNTALKFSPLEATRDLSTNKIEVEIIDKDACKYYSLGLLKNIKIKPSPDWMQKRLISSGIRAINNVVDITNYVLLEYGCPLHAFDYDKLDGYLSLGVGWYNQAGPYRGSSEPPSVTAGRKNYDGGVDLMPEFGLGFKLRNGDAMDLAVRCQFAFGLYDAYKSARGWLGAEYYPALMVGYRF